MGNYINGYSYPRMIIKDYTTLEVIESIDLDMCNLSGGMQESYQEYFKRNELESGRLVDFDFKGARIVFNLDYSQYARKSNLSKIEKLLFYNSVPDSYRLFITPRVDAQARDFEVRFLDGNYDLGILTGGANAVGHKLPVIKFITVIPQGKNFIDPDNLSIFSQYKVKF